jgi:hypothetical protein
VNYNRLRWSLRLVLLALLGCLLIYAWTTDSPSPAYPHGQFGELMLFTLLMVGLVALIWWVMKR